MPPRFGRRAFLTSGAAAALAAGTPKGVGAGEAATDAYREPARDTREHESPRPAKQAEDRREEPLLGCALLCILGASALSRTVPGMSCWTQLPTPVQFRPLLRTDTTSRPVRPATMQSPAAGPKSHVKARTGFSSTGELWPAVVEWPHTRLSAANVPKAHG